MSERARKKFYKVVKSRYRVADDGKNGLYVDGVYSELTYANGTAVRRFGGGLDMYRLTRKQKVRFTCLLARGLSIYADGGCIYTKHRLRYVRNG